MEATRAAAMLVGEDLGTVEDEVRAALSERDVFGYRIGWFAEDPPADWPANDARPRSPPTTCRPSRGLWSGQDATDRAAAGLAPDPDGDALLRPDWHALAASTLDRCPTRPDRRATGRWSCDAHACAGPQRQRPGGRDAGGCGRCRCAARTCPGTIDEHPNWRSRCPSPIEELDPAGAAELAAVMTPHGRDR